MDQRVLVERMLDPNFYPDQTTAVELVQTHVSFVFLTDRFVYKVKKPVDFGFLDFSTLEKRRHFCTREVELNARLCPDTYLGVVELRERDGVISIDGPGETFEVAVKMARLPHDRMLRALLERGEADTSVLRSIAATLAEFHARAAIAPELRLAKGLERVRFNCEENFQQTEAYVGRLVSDECFNMTRTSTELFLQRKGALLNRRALAGAVVDGHGDLHMDSICATDPVRIFDCIEFNERLRILDVAEDMGFLAMDLEFSGYPDLARVFVDEYVARSGDRELGEVLDFFKAYRAYVRAKIHSFQVDDPAIPAERRSEVGATATRYYELAARYSQGFNPQRLLIMCGLTGTGKSTLARKLAERCALQLVSSDQTRKELLGVDPHERHHDAYNHGAYAPSITDRTYEAMVRRAESLLANGHSVVLDGCFTRRDQRAPALELATRVGVSYLVLDCRAPESLIRERLDGRLEKGTSVSDGRWEIYRQQLERFEPPDEVPTEKRIILDRSKPVEVLVNELLDHLPSQWVDRS
jgi:aminoglycoside phosphotransferase family enzyme/predicted kinase